MRELVLIVFTAFYFASQSNAQVPQPTPNPKDYTAHVVGYAHMDMAWLWRWEESIHDVMYNTFTNQIRLMDENPDYTFSQDQAVVLDSMEHYYPDVFKGLQAKARTGNFIPATSSWVQMDENVSDGESMVRQFLYGQKYSKEKFGHYVRFAWQPDDVGPALEKSGGHMVLGQDRQDVGSALARAGLKREGQSQNGTEAGGGKK